MLTPRIAWAVVGLLVVRHRRRTLTGPKAAAVFEAPPPALSKEAAALALATERLESSYARAPALAESLEASSYASDMVAAAGALTSLAARIGA